METVQTKRSQRSEHNNDVLLPVNIKKFDDAWSKDVGFYIAFGKVVLQIVERNLRNSIKD